MNSSKVKAYDFCLWFRLSKFGNCTQAAHLFWTYSLALLETQAPRLRGCLKLFLEHRPWVHAKRGVKWKTGCEIRTLKGIFRLKNDMRMGFYLEKTAKVALGSKVNRDLWWDEVRSLNILHDFPNVSLVWGAHVWTVNHYVLVIIRSIQGTFRYW